MIEEDDIMDNYQDNIVRILEVNLKNYKNIKNGRVKMSDISNIERGEGNVLGIYGQNGSGKTSIISAVRIIKDVFSGKPLPEDIDEYIMYGEDCKCQYKNDQKVENNYVQKVA